VQGFRAKRSVAMTFGMTASGVTVVHTSFAA
jgi:hypothetical protein